MAKDEGRDVPPHWGPLKVEASDLSLCWGTWPLAAEGLSHLAPLPFPAGRGPWLEKGNTQASGREMQLDADAGWTAWGLTGPGREAAERSAGCPRAPVGSREWTPGQVVGSPPWSLPPWVDKNRLLPLHPSHQPRQTNATWVSAGGAGRER